MSIAPFLAKINAVILNPLITLLFAVALLVFLWGIFEFVKNSDDAKSREQGKQNILWGVIGMFIMFGVFRIIKIILATVGITGNSGFSLFP
jgi:hypothetical protein